MFTPMDLPGGSRVLVVRYAKTFQVTVRYGAVEVVGDFIVDHDEAISDAVGKFLAMRDRMRSQLKPDPIFGDLM